MHEFSLYGLVAKDDYRRTLMQLAGVARMQPQKVEEIRLIFKAKPPVGLNSLPSAGGSQGVQQQDVQRVKTMLNASLYYIQLVGRLSYGTSAQSSANHAGDNETKDNTQVSVQWSLEFKDTPDPGKQVVSSRLASKIPLEDGNPATFLEQLGYEYVSRYMISASELYDDHTTIALRQVLLLPASPSASEAGDISLLPETTQLQPLDSSGGYELHAFVDVVDGNHPELKDRATKQLLALKETLKQAVNLTPGDRLALDTKVPVAPRRL